MSMVQVPYCPECEAGKCGSCNGDALDDLRDEIVKCACPALVHVPTRALEEALRGRTDTTVPF